MDTDFKKKDFIKDGFQNSASSGRRILKFCEFILSKMNASKVCAVYKCLNSAILMMYDLLSILYYTVVVNGCVCKLSTPCIYRRDSVRLYRENLYMWRVCTHAQSG